jgi:predicted nucleic acid-binding protein
MRSPSGASAALVQLLRMGAGEFLVSVALMLEYESVCCRAEHRLASGLAVEKVRLYLDAIARLAKPVDIHFRWRPQLRDAGDEMVLETAVNGRADAVVTFHTRDFSVATTHFGIMVLSPGQVLGRIGE